MLKYQKGVHIMTENEKNRFAKWCWKKPEKILNLATLCVVPRNEAEDKILREYKTKIISLYS